MSILLLVVSLIVVGLVVGALARLVVPGRQRLSLGMTVALGLLGSLIGGAVAHALHAHGWAVLLCEVGAAAVLVALVSRPRRGARI